MKENNLFLYEKAMLYLANEILDHRGDLEYKLPTEAELSERMGVSRITAIKAFNAIEATGAIVRQKGRGTFIAKGADYSALLALDGSHRRSGKKVAAVFPLAVSYHVQQIIGGLMKNATDFLLSVASSEMDQNREKEMISRFLDFGVDGLILYPVDNEFYSSALLDLALKKFPVVMVDRFLNGLNFCSVASDHFDMARKAVVYLYERGHRHILFFNANILTNSSLTLRREAFFRTLAERGITRNYAYSFEGAREDAVSECRESFLKYLGANPEITAVVTADHASSRYLKHLVPELEDRKICLDAVYLDLYASEFDNLYAHPAFVEQDSFRIGAEAAGLIRRIMENPELEKENLLLPVRLSPKSEVGT